MNNITKFNTNFLDDKTIVIYNPYGNSTVGGGVTVLHYIGQILKSKNINIKMYTGNPPYEEIIFSDFITNYDCDKIIAIYPEITYGNPLNAKYVIRWILAPIGKFVDKNVVDSWGKNDLVYYFISEEKIRDSPEKYCSIYKLLTTIYLKPNIFINFHQPRNGYCHIIKKAYKFHKNGIQFFHPSDSVELSHTATFEELVQIFNQFEYFVCYDPCCFLIFLAGLCGCITILHKIDGISSIEQWFTGNSDIPSCFYVYYKNNEYSNYPGIAYGIENIEYARSTLHLLPYVLNKQIEYINNYCIDNFLKDMIKFDENINTVENNYY